MQTNLLIFFFFISTIVSGQNVTDTSSNRMMKVLDGIRIQMLDDTAKYNPADIIFTARGRRNTKPYSPMFIINGAYIYKLDIIKG